MLKFKKETPQVAEPEARIANTPRRQPRYPRLDTMADVKRELGRLYREVRAYRIDSADAGRFGRRRAAPQPQRPRRKLMTDGANRWARLKAAEVVVEGRWSAE